MNYIQLFYCGMVLCIPITTVKSVLAQEQITDTTLQQLYCLEPMVGYYWYSEI